MELTLHVLPDTWLLNANETGTTEAHPVISTAYLTDTAGNRLTDTAGNYLVGMFAETLQVVMLSALPNDFQLNAEQDSLVLSAVPDDLILRA